MSLIVRFDSFPSAPSVPLPSRGHLQFTRTSAVSLSGSNAERSNRYAPRKGISDRSGRWRLSSDRRRPCQVLRRPSLRYTLQPQLRSTQKLAECADQRAGSNWSNGMTELPGGVETSLPDLSALPLRVL